MFECNICLEPASEPVVTRCGHLFCWACLHTWISAPRRSQAHGVLQPSTGASVCPVCKAAVSAQTVTPIYTRESAADPRASDPSLPARPAGERLEPEPPLPGAAEPMAYGGTARQYSFSAGYGHFPVVCALVFRGASLLDAPMASRRAQLAVGALAGLAVLSMALM
mmetsp:Transcript_37328/g.107589  ORF Transcript_37328/g.107589 Transcript_37328/m.107589 type:complete len:166 (+) Transcript_37328:2-499(+)